MVASPGSRPGRYEILEPISHVPCLTQNDASRD